MKYLVLLASVLLTFTTTAHADLPMGLKCAPKTKIVGAEIGQEGTYQIQKGMQKEEHRALVNRKKATAVDGCHFKDLVPNDIVVVRYSGPEVYDTEVQCIDQNNDNAQVTFPKSIYTVRNSNISQWMLMPYCPDGKSKDDFPCSKAQTQSERSTEYQDTILKWKTAKKDSDKLHKIDLRFDPPYRDSVPAGAKLFCALIDKDGNVVIAGTAQYPGAKEAPAAEAPAGEGAKDEAAPSEGAAEAPAEAPAPRSRTPRTRSGAPK